MKRLTLFFVLVATGLGAAGTLYAHTGATGVVKQRMDLMSDIARQMKTIGAIARGKAAFDGASVSAAAARIADHGKHMPMLFPKDSLQPPSEATARIWRDWEKFVAAGEDMSAAAEALAAAGRSGDAVVVKDGFRSLGKTCSACHKDFREKKR